MKIFIILLFVGINTLYSQDNCLGSDEKNKIHQTFLNEYYSDVPNVLTCDSLQNKSSFLYKICLNKNLVDMFKVLSQANVYAYENATKREIDHKNFNKSHLSFNLMQYKDKKLDSLCYDLKKTTTELLGGLSPYKQLNLLNKKFFLQTNANGFILTSKNGYKIYLGNSCDALNSNNMHGFWYKNKNSYIIELNHQKIIMHNNISELDKNNCSLQTLSVLKLNETITKFPNRTVAYYNLGDAYWELGEKEKARKAYTTYIEQMCHKGLQKKIPKKVLQRVGNKQ